MEVLNSNEIVQLIKEKLSHIEERENIRIIYACESGSRAWGFASPDSDYDVRFIFVRPVHDYLRVKELPDFIDAELNEVYDINGWDLKKFCKHLYKSNPVLFEWADSPIVYKTCEDWEKVKAVMKDYICQRSMIHHYLGLAKCTIKKYLTGETINYKKYFYILRAVLAASWVFYKNTWAPTEYSKLVAAEITLEDKKEFEEMQIGSRSRSEKNSREEFLGESPNIYAAMADLYEKKSSHSENAAGKRNKGLENFINNRIAIIDASIDKCRIQNIEKQVFSWEKLNQVFLDIIEGKNG